MPDYKELHEFARRTYQEIAPDLYAAVPHGQGHHSAAHDHISDRLYDHFRVTHPKANFRSVTKAALKGYVDDDRVETRKWEAKQKRAENRPPRVRKPKAPKLTWWQELGYTQKPRKGIGSY